MSNVEMSQLGLWLLGVTNLVMILVLYRQFGLSALSTSEGHDSDGVPVNVLPPPCIVEEFADASHGERAEPRELTLPKTWNIVLFASPDCEPCVRAMERLNSEMPALTREQVQVAVILEFNDPAIQQPSLRNAYRFDSYRDSSGDTTSRAWGVKVTPFAFVIDPTGKVGAKGLVGSDLRLERLLADMRQLMQQAELTQ